MENSSRTNREKSPWATISIIVVIILFGLFWLWQREEIFRSRQIPPSQAFHAENEQNQKPDSLLFSIEKLQANTVNISIPSFESVF